MRNIFMKIAFASLAIGLPAQALNAETKAGAAGKPTGQETLVKKGSRMSNSPGSSAGTTEMAARIDALEKRLTRLGELEDIQAIRDLQVQYAHAADWGDHKSFADRHWPEATWDHGPFHGRLSDPRPDLGPSPYTGMHHFITNQAVTLTGPTTAKGEVYYISFGQLKAPAQTPDGHPANLHVWAGKYLEDFEKRDGVWKVIKHLAIIDFQGQAQANEISIGGRIMSPNDGNKYNVGSPEYMNFTPRQPAR